MEYLATTLEEKISALENKYAELFEQEESKEILHRIYQKIRFLQALQGRIE